MTLDEMLAVWAADCRRDDMRCLPMPADLAWLELSDGVTE
jgi:hypothetical protein